METKFIGHERIELIDPTATLNGRRISSRLLKGFAEGISTQLDLFPASDNSMTDKKIIRFTYGDQFSPKQFQALCNKK